MKMLVPIVLVAALAACGKEEPAGSSAQQEDLIGTWEGTVDEDGIEATVRLTFRADGTFETVVESPGVTMTGTGTYQVDGDRLRWDVKKITAVLEDGTELEIDDEGDLADVGLDGTFAIEGDTLSITGPEEDGNESVVTVEYRRI